MKKYKFAFLLILILGLTLRLWKLNIPLLEFYPTRQVQTAEITQNLIKDNFNFLYPRVDYYGPENIYYLYEFPGYNLIVAGIHKLTGDVNDINGRIVSVFSYLAATIFLYKIACGLFNRQIGLITIFFFSLSPLHILTSRSFQPDEMVLASSLGALYYLLRWSKKGSWYFLAISALFFTWAVLIKVVALVFLFLPIIYIFYEGITKKYKQSFSTNKHSFSKSKFLPVIYLLVSLIPTFLWYFHAFSVSTGLNTASSSAFNLSIWFGPENLINWRYYSTVFGFEYNLVILPVGMILFLIGLISRVNKNQMLVYWWLGGVAIYFLIFNKHNMTHEYYHLPIIPIASIFIGIGAEKILRGLNGLVLPRKLAIFLLFGSLVILMLPTTLSRAYKPIERFSSVPEAANALKAISKPDDLIVGVMDRGPTLIYYADRVGWNLGLDREQQQKEEEFYANKNYIPSSPQEDLEKYIAKGARYLVIANVNQLEDNKSFKDYITSRYKLIKGSENYLIFDLSFIQR